jgi:PAS domain S-box-containing protein
VNGYSGEEIIGKHISVFYATKEEPPNEQSSIDLKTAKETGRCEYEGWKSKKDGSKFYANTVVTLLLNEDNSFKAFAKITRDITIRKKLEEENKLLTSQLEEKVDQRTKELAIVVKELEAFSYSVSHDLRRPCEQ